MHYLQCRRIKFAACHDTEVSQPLPVVPCSAGEIKDIFIPRDRATQRSRGFAFVRYATREEADRAVAGTDGRDLHGRSLRVEVAKIARVSSPRNKSWDVISELPAVLQAAS